MADALSIRPMGGDMVLWRCLHSGPLTAHTLDHPPPTEGMAWDEHRALNVPLLDKLSATYGSCAMLAWDGEAVVGFLRFYPKAVYAMEDAGGMCLQQAWPAGPSPALLDKPFPALAELADKTLCVHCLMTGSPQMTDNPYQRIGLGTRLARELVNWAGEQGWERIEVQSYEDVDPIYRITGQTGRTFWERLGFLVTKVEKAGLSGGFLEAVERALRAQGLDPRSAQNLYTLRKNLVR